MSIFSAITIAAGMLLAGASGVAAATVLHRGNGPDPETLDPHKASGIPEANIAMDLFEGLFMADAEARVVPGAAERVSVAADGLTYTFHLRPDGRWSDGTPVTAHDFVFSWRRLVDPATAFKYAWLLWPVQNAEAISKGAIADLRQLGVSALDDRTFQVTLRQPTPYLIAATVHPSTYPLAPANLARAGRRFLEPGTLVSNGAYVLADRLPQSHVALVRNPYHRDAATIRIDRVVFHTTEDRNAELRRFRAGDLDLSYEVPEQQLPWIRTHLAQELRIAPYFGTYFYAFNMTRLPWRDAAPLREALSLAIDRRLIVDRITQADQVPAFSYVPPGIAGYQQQTLLWADWSQDARDARARQLLSESGYAGEPVEIFFNTNDNHRKLAIAVAGMWQQKLGVNAILTNQEWKSYLGARDRKTYSDLIRVGWIGDYMDASNFLDLMRSDIGAQNPAGWSDPAYDALLRRAAGLTDPSARAAVLAEAEALLLNRQVLIPLFFYTSRKLVSRHVSGYRDNVMDQHPTRTLAITRPAGP